MKTQLSLKYVTSISKTEKLHPNLVGMYYMHPLYAFHSIQPLDLQITSINRWDVKNKMKTQLSLKYVTSISKTEKLHPNLVGMYYMHPLYAFHSIQPLDLQITSINRWKVNENPAHWLPKK
uniref:Putative ovule protein n=1 Tax=Solanum chacoense TaxID=4108 RepID=A0A0V0GWG1_SOLCH